MKTPSRPAAAALLLCLVPVTLVSRPAEAQPRVQAMQVATDRQAVIDTFYDRWLRNTQVPVGWTGNVETCTPGTTSVEAEAATIDQINFYRELVGSPPAVVDRTQAAMPQRAALMMHANGALMHVPPPTWRCYQEPFTHNLLTVPPAALGIQAYIDDRGQHNLSVGHRRTLLDPRVTGYAFGSTDQYNALLVTHSNLVAPPSSAWVAWPPAGLVALPLVTGRWSAAIADTARDDPALSAASVSMIGPTGPFTPTIVSRDEQQIVFEIPPEVEPGSEQDTSFTVTISGITQGGAAAPDYTYTVTLVRPDRSVVAGTPPSLTGDLKVGGTLTAVPATWGTVDTRGTGKWFRDGTAIANTAGDTRYTVVRGDRGRQISYQETGSARFYLPTTVSSGAVLVPDTLPALEPQPAPELTLVRRPRIRGTLKVGQVLRAVAGKWQPLATSTTFRWKRGTKIVSKRKRLRLTRAFVGKRVTLRVTARRGGYEPAVITIRTRRVRR